MSTSTYPLAKLLSLWAQGALSAEQMAGHLLQHALEQEKRIHRLEMALGVQPQPLPPPLVIE